jgi:hypothetical protein
LDGEKLKANAKNLPGFLKTTQAVERRARFSRAEVQKRHETQGSANPALSGLRAGIPCELESELGRLKASLGLGQELGVEWLPGRVKHSRGGQLSGEVVGGAIHVYEEDRAAALATLRHEFLDYAVSRAIEPYRRVANALISMINEDAYRRKEKLVEALSQLIKG